MARLARLLSDYILVQLEPEQEKTAGGIIKLGPEPVRTGHVLMVGPGRDYVDRFVPMPDLIGKRIAFMIAASQTKKGQAVRRQLSLADDQEVIRLGDVLFEVDEGVRVSK